MKTAYLTHIEQRAKDNLPPLVLNAQQTKSVVG
jgi:aconitase B